MGLDAAIWVRGDITDEQVEMARERFIDCYGKPTRLDNEGDVSREEYDEKVVSISADCQRYFGSGYQRGNWPRIAALIRVTQAAFPGRPVYYGWDCYDDYTDPVTEELMNENWELWLRPNHMPTNYIADGTVPCVSTGCDGVAVIRISKVTRYRNITLEPPRTKEIEVTIPAYHCETCDRHFTGEDDESPVEMLANKLSLTNDLGLDENRVLVALQYQGSEVVAV